MNENESRESDVSILSAHDIDTNLLIDFYRSVYPKRMNSLPRIWKWLNRSSYFDNQIPLVILHKNRIVAHAGLIPFKFLLDGEYHSACWFIDFVVPQEFQRRGLGYFIQGKRMEFSDVSLGFPTEISCKLYSKIGFCESFKTNLLFYLLLPFNHPRFADSIPGVCRKLLNVSSRSFLSFNYHRYASPVDNLRFDDLNLNLLNKAISFYKIEQSATVEPVRDSEYISWRLLDSPDRRKYRIVRMDGVDDVSIIVKLCDNRPHLYIDILWLSNPTQHAEVRNLIATLAIWGLRQGYSYIRHYVSSKEHSSFLSRSLKAIVRHPRLMFYSKNPELFQKLKDSNWHWDLMDSDFEEF